jgi:serpin B
MTYAGARGQTKRQMAKVLHFDLVKTNIHSAFNANQKRLEMIGQRGTAELKIANALWMQQDHAFTKNYTDLIANNYGSKLNRVNFKKAEDAAKKINGWVQHETNNKISELVTADTIKAVETRLILTNAIYFQGRWSHPFKKVNTKVDTFWRSPKDKIKVPMMFQQSQVEYMENNLFQAVTLPYIGYDVSMKIILPKNHKQMNEVVRSLNKDTFRSWSSYSDRTDVKMYLPKFKINSESHLSKTLVSMGMTNAFNNSADFSGMDGTKSLYLSDVIHKAFIDVNEEGTEAAAATESHVGMKSAATPSIGPPKEFRADHPFIFLIQDRRSGNILFMGVVNNPK